MEAFILILMIAGVGITVAAVKSGGSNADAAWRAAAQRLGLRFERKDMLSSPNVSGTRRGRSVRIDTYAKSGGSSKTYTRYHVGFERSLELGLRLTHHGLLDRCSRRLGMRDIVIGDEGFDKAIVVQGRDAQRVVQFFTPRRKRQVLRFLTRCPGAIVDDAGIEYETRNVERSPDLIVGVIQRMTGLAEVLTTEEDCTPDYLEAMADPVDAEVHRHSRGLPYHLEPGPISLEDLLVVESEPGELTESSRSFLEAHEAIDEEILSEAEPPEPNELLTEEWEAAEPSPSNDVGPSISTVVETLFAPGQTTSEMAEVFESRYKGRSVEWSGTLTNVRSYRFDLVFGDVPGTRAEIEFAGPANSPSAGRAVRAVVRCPAEAEDRLRTLVDHPVVFQGVLISCDAFLKTMFLTDGKIGEAEA